VVDGVALDNDTTAGVQYADAFGGVGGTVIGVAGDGIGLDGPGCPTADLNAVLGSGRDRPGAGNRVSGDRGAGTAVLYGNTSLFW